MKILFLQKRLLFPPNTGGKIRTLNVLRHLARWHNVTYLCNIQPGEEAAADQMRSLGVTLETIPWQETPRSSPLFYAQLAANLLSPHPFNVNKDFDPRLRERAVELLATGTFDLVICDFVQMARNITGVPGAPKVLFEHNVEAQIFERHAKSDSGWLRRQYMRLQWKKLERFEGAAGRDFDAVIAVSQQDKATFEKNYGWRHVEVIDTAVDLDYFEPGPAAEEVADRCVFVGSMDWLPNQDGVRFFVEQVWPRIRAERPNATFQVVGRNPTPAIRELARVPGVEIVGTVPDIRPHLREAAIVVVSLLVGGGTRLKIFEAFAMQKAVVSTPLGSEGLEVTDGRHLQNAESADELAEAVIALLRDNARRAAMGDAARALVVEKYSAESVARQFERICLRAAEKSRATRPAVSAR
jgi:sugar transferase (PEP-CTERM/EpsH1 system associated)